MTIYEIFSRYNEVYKINNLRDSYSIYDIEELLVRYHTKFVNYFEKIISLVIPDGYMDKKMDFSDNCFVD